MVQDPSLPSQKDLSEAVDKHAEDLIEIQQLLGRYCHVLDRGSVDEIMEAFHPDVLFLPSYEGVQQYKGHDAVRNWYTNYKERNQEALLYLRHTITSPMIHVNGHEATSVCNLDADSVVKETKQAIHFMGRYEDKLVKEDGCWQLIERKIIVDRTYVLGQQPAP